MLMIYYMQHNFKMCNVNKSHFSKSQNVAPLVATELCVNHTHIVEWIYLVEIF